VKALKAKCYKEVAVYRRAMKLDEGGLDQILSPTTDINQVNQTVTQPATQNQMQKGRRAASGSQPGPSQTPKKQKKTRDDNPKQPRAATSNSPAGKHLAFVKLIVKDLDEIQEWHNASLLSLDETVNLDSMQPVRTRNGIHCFTLSFRNADDLNNCLNLRDQFPVEVAGVIKLLQIQPFQSGKQPFIVRNAFAAADSDDLVKAIEVHFREPNCVETLYQRCSTKSTKMEGLVVDIIKPFKVSPKTPIKMIGLGPNGIARWDVDDAPSGCPWCTQVEDHDVLDCPKASHT
jgi:hypothetical protein